ncbi:MAG: GNAT family N-acetyltransferase [Dehalococcoidia bacterium]|jgi:N-acetylglutamate synthase-like GNAT family acetyltransferase
MSIKIRKAKVEDADGIVEVMKQAGKSVYSMPTPYVTTTEKVAAHIKMCHADKSHTIYVAENESGQIVGYVAAHWLPYLFLDGPEGYLSELFIDESYRGNSIGTKLLETVKEEARKRGCSRLLLLNSRKRESYQRSFYKKHGWTEREEAANFVYNLK